MPVQKQQSSLLAKLGDKLKAAHEEHKGDETVISSLVELPGGVRGIARLVSMKFGIFKTGDNQGEFYFFAQAAVIKANMKEFEGAYTKIGPEAMCDTPKSTVRKTVSDHLAWVYDQLRPFGVDTTKLKPEQLEATVATLAQMKPTFRFETFQGKPQTTGPYAGREPRVMHRWLGLCDAPEEGDAGAGVEDSSGPSGGNGMTHNAAVNADEVLGEAHTAGDFNEFGDLESLGQSAQEGDVDAQMKLEEMAERANCKDKTDVAENWMAAAKIIQKATKGQTLAGDEEDEVEEGEPLVDDEFDYFPVEKGAKAKKAERCTVVSVNRAKKTVTLQSNVRANKQFKNVAWDDLVGE